MKEIIPDDNKRLFSIKLFHAFFLHLVVVMVMDTEAKFARPVAHLYKGQTFGVGYK